MCPPETLGILLPTHGEKGVETLCSGEDNKRALTPPTPILLDASFLTGNPSWEGCGDWGGGTPPTLREVMDASAAAQQVPGEEQAVEQSGQAGRCPNHNVPQ